MSEFWRGFLAFPFLVLALTGVFVVLYALLHPAGSVSSECGSCSRWRVSPKRFEPWWVYLLRNRISYRHHMRDDADCREASNRWLERRGSDKRYAPSGRFR